MRTVFFCAKTRGKSVPFPVTEVGMKKHFISFVLLMGLLAQPLVGKNKKAQQLEKLNSQARIAQEKLVETKNTVNLLKQELSQMAEKTEAEREEIQAKLQDALSARENARKDVDALHMQINDLSLRIKLKEEEAAALKLKNEKIAKEKQQVETKLKEAVHKKVEANATNKKLEQKAKRLEERVKKIEEEKARSEVASLYKQKELQNKLKSLHESQKKNEKSALILAERQKENARLQDEINQISEALKLEQSAVLKEQEKAQNTIEGLLGELAELQKKDKDLLVQLQKALAQNIQLRTWFVADFKKDFTKAINGSLSKNKAEKTATRYTELKKFLVSDPVEYYKFLIELADLAASKLKELIKAGKESLDTTSQWVGLPEFLEKMDNISLTICEEISATNSQLKVFKGSKAQVDNLEAGILSIINLFGTVKDASARSTSKSALGALFKKARSKYFEIGKYKDPIRVSATVTQGVLQDLKNQQVLSDSLHPGMVLDDQNSAFALASEL